MKNNACLCLQIQIMGNTEYREQELLQYAPQMQNYTLAHCYSPLSIYRHLYSSEEIMEFKERLFSTQDIDRKVQTFVARYQHIYLVSTLYMKLEGGENCGSTEYELSIYYERVVTNLSKINEISFKDSLHCLAVALKGFEILYKNYGYFQIFQNMFHISQRGRLKVWCNQNIYKNVPQQYLLGDGKEEDMVIKIINIIDMNTDQNCKVFPVRETLVNLNKVTFANVIVALRQICRENNFVISEHLESLQNFAQFQSVLDIYGPPKRFPKDTQITFHPKSSQSAQFGPQRGSTGTPMRSSSSSSHRTSNKIIPSERGKSMEASRNTKQNNGFQLTHAQQDQFPKFMAARPKAPSKSNSSSSKRLSSSPNFKPNLAQNTKTSHPHLQQFSKVRNQESQLKKRVVPENEQQISRYSYVPSQTAMPQPPHEQHSIIYGYRPVSNHEVINSPIKTASAQRPSTPQPQQVMQRQASAPLFVTAQPQNQYIRVNPQPQYVQAPVRNMVYYPAHNPIPRPTYQRPVQQPVASYRYPIHNNHQNPQPIRQVPIQQPVVHFNQAPSAYLTSSIINQNSQLYHLDQSRNLEKSRGLSVPVKMTYQGINSKQLLPSPKKKQSEMKPQSSHYQSSSKNEVYNNPKQRLVTLGQISAQKSPQPDKKIDKKDDKFQLMQLQSKIEMLQSFADNKITTQQFLPNQSHALSNIKWEKNSNSGRDSVTSAFRKDILLELSNKPSQKKTFDERKDDYLSRKDPNKYTSKFDDNGYYTNQRLLQIIKTGGASKSYDSSRLTFEEKMKKYEKKYEQPDNVKEFSRETQPSNFYNDLYKKYSQKSTLANNIFGDETSTPTFGTHEKAPFKKKTQPYINKISAISQKWQQENICSTSNGSRGRNIHSSNIDEDILEDMHNEGFGMQFKKGR